MNTNSLVFEIMRGKWLMNFSNVAEYEKLANKYISGEFVGQPLDRKSFRASYDNGNIGGGLSQGTTEEKVIGYLMMTGPMSTYGDMCTYGADDYLYALRKLNNNDKVSAIVLEIDGPGGAVPAINAFKEFKSEKRKPIVVLANDCYSLHYWIACLLADHIMAKGNISSGFGSLGATCILLDAREAMAKEGLKVMIINAPGSDLKNKAMQDFYEGKDEDFKTRLQAELKPIRDVFEADVRDSFPDIASDERIFQADNFSADEALKLKMIHSIGNEKKAFELAKALAEMREAS
ncbi:MAG: S49 family peptidase [Chryseobacterium sp.]